jgi:hypothetical protein
MDLITLVARRAFEVVISGLTAHGSEEFAVGAGFAEFID